VRLSARLILRARLWRALFFKRTHSVVSFSGRFLSRARPSPTCAGTFRNPFHAAFADYAFLEFLDRGVAMGVGIFVLALDKEPIVPLCIARASAAQSHKMPAALKSLAMESECQISAREIALRIADRLPGPLVPEHHGAPAVLSLGIVPSNEP
jgi:hypothetical protein